MSCSVRASWIHSPALLEPQEAESADSSPGFQLLASSISRSPTGRLQGLGQEISIFILLSPLACLQTCSGSPVSLLLYIWHIFQCGCGGVWLLHSSFLVAALPHLSPCQPGGGEKWLIPIAGSGVQAHSLSAHHCTPPLKLCAFLGRPRRMGAVFMQYHPPHAGPLRGHLCREMR